MKKRPNSFLVKKILEKTQQKTQEKNPSRKNSNYWVCKECNYVHEGDQPPEKCPVCGVDAEEFIKRSLDKDLV